MKRFTRILSLFALLSLTTLAVACDDGDDKSNDDPIDTRSEDVVAGDDAALDEDVPAEADLAIEEDIVEPTATLLAGFEDLTLDTESAWDGADGSGLFVSGQLSFINLYNQEYMSWDGYGYSNMTDTTTPGWDNQFSVAAGTGAEDTANYAVAHDGSGYGVQAPTFLVEGDDPVVIAGAWVNNTTYTYLSMSEGDDFAKKFGGEEGADEDWFMLTFTGIDAEGNETGTVEFYLADFRGDDDYIVNTWKFVDLSSLGAVAEVQAVLTSSDVGEFGMNTPAYFAIDQIVAAAE